MARRVGCGTPNPLGRGQWIGLRQSSTPSVLAVLGTGRHALSSRILYRLPILQTGNADIVWSSYGGKSGHRPSASENSAGPDVESASRLQLGVRLPSGGAVFCRQLSRLRPVSTLTTLARTCGWHRMPGRVTIQFCSTWPASCPLVGWQRWQYLDLPSELRWTVCDIPEMKDLGQDYAIERNERSLHFDGSPERIGDAGLLASGLCIISTVRYPPCLARRHPSQAHHHHHQ